MIAEMVRQMVAKGVDIDVICLAVETAELALRSANSTGIPPDSTGEKRRAWDRERKRNSTGIPPDSTGIPNTPLSSLNNKNRKRGERLPENWSPSGEDRSLASKLGWSDSQIDSESANFRDYWIARPGAGGVKLDWPATWRRWVRSSKIKPSAPVASGYQPETNWRAILESYTRFKHWPKGHGNEPGMSSCRAPPELLKEFGLSLGSV